jgi:hypothetical protein
MTSKKDQARMDDLNRMVDRLHRRLETQQNHSNILARMLEILQEKFAMSDEEIDAIRAEAVNDNKTI